MMQSWALCLYSKNLYVSSRSQSVFQLSCLFLISVLTISDQFLCTIFTHILALPLFLPFSRRCGSGQNLTADMKPKYNLLSMSESAEEEDGGFFSNRNIELANRSSSNSLFDSERINSPPSDISNPPHHSSSSGRIEGRPKESLG